VGVTYIRSGYDMGLNAVVGGCGGSRRAEVTAEYIVRVALQNYSERGSDAGRKGESGELSKHAVTAARRLHARCADDGG
jgi:hypothetical protein